jgi:hypothetical protein
MMKQHPRVSATLLCTKSIMHELLLDLKSHITANLNYAKFSAYTRERAAAARAAYISPAYVHSDLFLLQ